jgi:hypothetical protein
LAAEGRNPLGCPAQLAVGSGEGPPVAHRASLAFRRAPKTAENLGDPCPTDPRGALGGGPRAPGAAVPVGEPAAGLGGRLRSASQCNLREACPARPVTGCRAHPTLRVHPAPGAGGASLERPALEASREPADRVRRRRADDSGSETPAQRLDHPGRGRDRESPGRLGPRQPDSLDRPRARGRAARRVCRHARPVQEARLVGGPTERHRHVASGVAVDWAARPPESAAATRACTGLA